MSKFASGMYTCYYSSFFHEVSVKMLHIYHNGTHSLNVPFVLFTVYNVLALL